MTTVDKLKKEEVAKLDGELNLEDLIILGDDKKIPIEISFPTEDGTSVKAKALVRQLTIRELEDIKVNEKEVWKTNIKILQRTLFKHDGTPYSTKEIKVLPIGVISALVEEIMKLSGVDLQKQQLVNF